MKRRRRSMRPIAKITCILSCMLYPLTASATTLTPEFQEEDAKYRKLRKIRLELVQDGLNEPTDIQFVPQQPNIALILEKGGALRWFDLSKATPRLQGLLAQLDVAKDGEAGLLGLAFHPDFPKDGRFYLNYTIRREQQLYAIIAEWRLSTPQNLSEGRAYEVRSVLEIELPTGFHNGGQLAFGPDSYLYASIGDGYRSANAQDPSRLLGKMLRVDVDCAAKTPYCIPESNPFLNDERYRPEIYALGLRNPWRFSFDAHGQLIVADVGDMTKEEVNLVPPGANLGWPLREGDIAGEGRRGLHQFHDPFIVYSQDDGDGYSITGGYQYRGKSIRRLKDHYVYGDFETGRIWAAPLPKPEDAATYRLESGDIYSMGVFPVSISTFGQNASGEIYVADYVGGKLYQLIQISR